jgi:CheY-like chemotaxis protein
MRERVLFVDDERKMPEYYTAKLEKSDFEVVRRRDPDEALDYLAQHGAEVRVTILDIMMPSGDVYRSRCGDDDTDTGLFLYSDIRERYPRMPIVVLTNRSGSKLFDQQPADPWRVILWKPNCMPSELVEQVRALISPRP